MRITVLKNYSLTWKGQRMTKHRRKWADGEGKSATGDPHLDLAAAIFRRAWQDARKGSMEAIQWLESQGVYRGKR